MNWNRLAEVKPKAYEITGLFHGKRTNKMLVCDILGNYYIGYFLVGFMDSSDFCDFHTLEDSLVEDIEFWVEINKPQSK
jgi:hypothetical protein